MGAARATVLIVDDDPGVTLTFGRMLQLEGYEVLSTLEAEAGLHAIATSHPDAVLLDLRMPFTDGLMFLRQLRAHDDRTPVAIITGDYSIDETLSRELRALDAVICFKPLWLADLVAIIERLLRRIQ